MTRVLPLGLVVSVAALVFPACEAPPARAEPAARTMAWQTLGSWSGTGNRQTESFEVTTGALRLHWEATATGSPDQARVQVWLHSAISGRPLQLLVDRTGTGSGEAYAADDPRTSYLVIESDAAAWSMRLDEGRHLQPSFETDEER